MLCQIHASHGGATQYDLAVTPASRRERDALCDLLIERGPSARTLCDGWTAADLATHLIVRERKPWAAASAALPPLAGYTERTMRRLRDGKSFPALVDLVRAGPPKWSPLGITPGIEAAANTVEFFVHHEDLRRTADQWKPRELDSDLEGLLWRRLTRTARLLLRKAPVGVTLERPDGATARGHSGEPMVTVRGRVGELVLFTFGRQAASQVSYDGDEDAVRRLHTAKLGF